MCAQKTDVRQRKRGGDREIVVFCSLSNRHSFGEAVPEGETLALFVKALQRCAGCCVERLVAGLALVASQPPVPCLWKLLPMPCSADIDEFSSKGLFTLFRPPHYFVVSDFFLLLHLVVITELSEQNE